MSAAEPRKRRRRRRRARRRETRDDGAPLPVKLPVIALGHRSRVGKDSCARAIVRAVPHARRVAFADVLKDSAHALLGRYGLRSRAHYDEHPEARLDPLPQLGGATAVEVWVSYGDACRALHPDVWVDAVLHRGASSLYGLLVISDLRYPNEFRAVQAAGGWCVRVDRPGASLPVHGSDELLDESWPWDATLTNDGALEDLERAAVDLATSYLEGAA